MIHAATISKVNVDFKCLYIQLYFFKEINIFIQLEFIKLFKSLSKNNFKEKYFMKFFCRVLL